MRQKLVLRLGIDSGWPLNIHPVFVEDSTLALCEFELLQLLRCHVADHSSQGFKSHALVFTLLNVRSVFPKAPSWALTFLWSFRIAVLFFQRLNLDWWSLLGRRLRTVTLIFRVYFDVSSQHDLPIVLKFIPDYSLGPSKVESLFQTKLPDHDL